MKYVRFMHIYCQGAYELDFDDNYILLHLLTNRTSLIPCSRLLRLLGHKLATKSETTRMKYE